MLFGGEGSSAMLKIARDLQESDIDLQLIAICGKNVKLADRIRTAAGASSDARRRVHERDSVLHEPQRFLHR